MGGDIGTSPIAAAALTGFDLVLDISTTTFSTSPLVEGNIYAASYTAPTPAKLTTAISNMETAFVDAAGRSIPDHIELYTGDLTGAGVALSAKPALTPGLYKWGTGVGFTGVVKFIGSSTDIWILQIAKDLTVEPGANIILEGGALPENIFWQVSGKTSIGAGAHVQGILLSKTAIIFDTGSSLTGRALSQTAVTMSSTTITAGPPLPSAGPSLLASAVPSSLPSVIASSLPSTYPSPLPSSVPSLSANPSSLPSVFTPEPVVNLGTAEDFVILTKTGVTTTPGGLITGDIGTNPIAGTALTGFNLVLDSSTTFSTSSLVEGKI